MTSSGSQERDDLLEALAKHRGPLRHTVRETVDGQKSMG